MSTTIVETEVVESVVGRNVLSVAMLDVLFNMLRERRSAATVFGYNSFRYPGGNPDNYFTHGQFIQTTLGVRFSPERTRFVGFKAQAEQLRDAFRPDDNMTLWSEPANCRFRVHLGDGLKRSAILSFSCDSPGQVSSALLNAARGAVRVPFPNQPGNPPAPPVLGSRILQRVFETMRDGKKAGVVSASHVWGDDGSHAEIVRVNFGSARNPDNVELIADRAADGLTTFAIKVDSIPRLGPFGDGDACSSNPSSARLAVIEFCNACTLHAAALDRFTTFLRRVKSSV